jgi:hypothetical protein
LRNYIIIIIIIITIKILQPSQRKVYENFTEQQSIHRPSSTIFIHRPWSPEWSNSFRSDQFTLHDLITVITFGEKQNCKVPSLYVFLPFSLYSFAFKSKYSPQPCLLKLPQFVFLSGSEEQSFMPISYMSCNYPILGFLHSLKVNILAP